MAKLAVTWMDVTWIIYTAKHKFTNRRFLKRIAKSLARVLRLPRFHCSCTTVRCSPPYAQVGIIPTDTYPALVCDVRNDDSVARLDGVKHMRRTRQLSLLC